VYSRSIFALYGGSDPVLHTVLPSHSYMLRASADQVNVLVFVSAYYWLSLDHSEPSLTQVVVVQRSLGHIRSLDLTNAVHTTRALERARSRPVGTTVAGTAWRIKGQITLKNVALALIGATLTTVTTLVGIDLTITAESTPLILLLARRVHFRLQPTILLLFESQVGGALWNFIRLDLVGLFQRAFVDMALIRLFIAFTRGTRRGLFQRT